MFQGTPFRNANQPVGDFCRNQVSTLWRVPRGTRQGTCCYANHILFDANSRLLLFILLNIIHASKRVTLVPCPITTLAEALSRSRILAEAHSSFYFFQKAHTREIADAINMASASTPMRNRHSSREAPASASRTLNRTASSALNQTVRIPPLDPLHLYTSDVARDSIFLTAVARQIAAARTPLPRPLRNLRRFCEWRLLRNRTSSARHTIHAIPFLLPRDRTLPVRVHALSL